MRPHFQRILRRMLFFVVLLVIGPVLLPVAAGGIDGASFPEFRAALSQWLDGDEETALGSFRKLAKDNNVAAQTLLAIIDKSGHLQGPYLFNLEREERISLLRIEGGLSGRSWIYKAADVLPLAQNLHALWTVTDAEALAQDFILAGEDHAARAALLVIAARQEKGFPADYRTYDWYPESLLHLTATFPPESNGADDLHPGHPVREAIGQSVDIAALSEWLGQSQLALPLRGACKRECPQTVQSCSLALYTALDSYHALLKLGSPLSTLVKEEDFAHSQRNSQSVARRIMLNHTARTREGLHSKIAEIDICAAQWLAQEFARYAPKPLLPVKAPE